MFCLRKKKYPVKIVMLCTEIDNMKKINKQGTTEMAERLAKEAETFVEKAKIKLNTIDEKELSVSDALIFLTEGINLERTILLGIECLKPGQLIEPTRISLAHLEKELEHLNRVDIKKLPPVEVIQYLMKAIKLEWACRGIPENIMNAYRIDFDSSQMGYKRMRESLEKQIVEHENRLKI